MSAGLSDSDGTVHLHNCKLSCLRVDPGWWDQGCLQHTSMILPCGVASSQGESGCQVMGPQSAPYRGIWDPLYAVSLVLT